MLVQNSDKLFSVVIEKNIFPINLKTKLEEENLKTNLNQFNKLYINCCLFLSA